MKIAISTTLLALGLFLGAAGTATSATTGTWDIRPASDGSYEVTWTSPEALPVTSDRPEILLDGIATGTAVISPDGKRVSATVPAMLPPTPDRLAISLSGRLLDRNESEAPLAAEQSWTGSTSGISKLGFDPGRKGNHAIHTGSYVRPSWKYPGLRRKLEMKARVVAPASPSVAAAGPLVLFLHGRHSTCYRRKPARIEGGWPCPKGTRPIPSDLGYDYLQRVLASQGYVTVSVAANGINGQDEALPDGGANARAALVRRHLDFWSDAVASGRRQADMSRVILVGHSRGGEGANRAAALIPGSAPYRIAGQVLLAPTNFARQSAAYIPTVTVLPYCDGDVSDLQGQAYTDNSIKLAPGDDSLKSSVVMFGANHNFFNTEWTPGISKAESADDSWAPPRSLCGIRGKTRLNAREQRGKALSYVAGAVQLMTGSDDRSRVLFDGSPVQAGPTTRAAVISQSVGAGKVTLVPGSGVKPAAGGSAGVFTCRGYAGEGRLDCAHHIGAEVTPHWPSSYPPGIPTRPALAMSWKKPGRIATLALGHELDLAGMSSLDLRVVVDPDTRTARFGVSLIDAAGNRIALGPSTGSRVNGMPSGQSTPGRWLARTLRLPVPAPGSSSFDFSRVTGVRLLGARKPACGPGCPGMSRIRVLDISARPAGSFPAPPADRLALVRLKPTRVPEGGTGRRIAEVPFTITGNVTDPAARFRVIASGETGTTRIRPITVPVAPGQTSGTLRIPYRGNNAFDLRRTIEVEVYPVRGVIPATSAVSVRLKDDDPKPRVRVRAVSRTVQSGRPARWRVSLSKPTGWPPVLDAGFAPASGLPELRLGNLPAGWLARRTFGTDGAKRNTPLSRTNASITLGWLPTRKPQIIRIPTRPIFGGPDRGIRLKLRIAGLGRTFSPPIRIRPN